MTNIDPLTPAEYLRGTYPNIVSLHIRENASVAHTLEVMRKWIAKDLVPFINKNINFLSENWITETNRLIAEWESLSTILVNDVREIADGVGNSVAEAQSAKTAAEAARDLAEQFASQAREIQDVAISTIFNDIDSVFRNAANSVFAKTSDMASVLSELNGRLSEAEISESVNTAIAENARKSGIEYLRNYPRLNGETDDAFRFARALAACGASGAKIIEIGPGETINIESRVNVTIDFLTIRGASKASTTINFGSDVIGFNVTGQYVSFENLRMTTNVVNRENYPVKFDAANQGRISSCYFGGMDGSRRFGVYFSAGSMGLVENSVFNHSCVRVETWDVKISDTYIWAMSCDFGIGLFNGAGNFTAINVDVVPPLVSNPNGICGILIDGNTGNPFNAKLSNIYLDGNPGLVVREGIMVGEGAGAILIENVNANRMDSDCIVIDSAFNVIVSNYSGHTNNASGAGSREIVVKRTGAQFVENVLLTNIQCLMPSAINGTKAPAIVVEDTVGVGQVSIESFNIKQPGALTAYSLPEVSVPVVDGYPTQSMRGKGQGTTYSAIGSQNVNASAQNLTINIGSPVAMAYRARPSQIALSCEGAPMPPYRVQYTNNNQIFVAFSTSFAAPAVIHWRAHLER